MSNRSRPRGKPPASQERSAGATPALSPYLTPPEGAIQTCVRNPESQASRAARLQRAAAADFIPSREPSAQGATMGPELIAAASFRQESALRSLGFRLGDQGTLSTRPILLPECSELLDALPGSASAEDYRAAVVDDNLLAKPTRGSRLVTFRCLKQIYGFNPAVPLFRVLRRLWAFERSNLSGRMLLGVLVALARDPLFRVSTGPVLSLRSGDELQRTALDARYREKTGARFNRAVLAKVAGNAARSWTQSGHLQGKRRKFRRAVRATPAAASLAVWLAEAEGLLGMRLIDSGWAAALDAPAGRMLELAAEASRLGLIRLRASGNVVEASARALDPEAKP